ILFWSYRRINGTQIYLVYYFQTLDFRCFNFSYFWFGRLFYSRLFYRFFFFHVDFSSQRNFLWWNFGNLFGNNFFYNFFRFRFFYRFFFFYYWFYSFFFGKRKILLILPFLVIGRSIFRQINLLCLLFGYFIRLKLYLQHTVHLFR